MKQTNNKWQRPFKLMNSLDWMILKAWIRFLITVGEFLLLSCHQMLQVWHFWREVGKASRASADLSETLFNIKACIISLVHQPLSAKQFHFNSTLSKCTMKLSSLKAMPAFFLPVPPSERWHQTVAKEHAKPSCLGSRSRVCMVVFF